MNQFALETHPRLALYREIPLTQGQVALVDLDDYEALSRFTWCAAWNEHTSSYYAIRSIKLTRGRKGKNYTMRMHRQIMGLDRFDPRRVDHIEPSQTLDNRRCNLRLATHGQNMWNQRLRACNTTGYKGVFRVSATGLFGAGVACNGVNYHCGFFKNPEDAYAARCAKALELHGQFARFE